MSELNGEDPYDFSRCGLTLHAMHIMLLNHY